MAATDEETGTLEPPMLVFDGSCGFCQGSVQFILRHERRHDLHFVPRESELGLNLRRTYGMETVESMLWIEHGHAFARASSVLKIAAYLGGWWSGIGRVGSIVPAPLLNWLYKLIARNRRRLSPGPEQCLVPTPAQRSRFLG